MCTAEVGRQNDDTVKIDIFTVTILYLDMDVGLYEVHTLSVGNGYACTLDTGTGHKLPYFLLGQ